MASLSFPRNLSLGIDAAPGSPPDLTNSKSSKSSSFHSSVLSDVTGPEDLAHFEDITLDDLQDSALRDRYDTLSATGDRRIVEKRSVTRAVSSTHIRPIAPPQPAPRDLTNGAKNKFASLQGLVAGAGMQPSSLSIPSRKSMRRGFTSPSTPSLTANQPSMPARRSRSSSPSDNPAATSPQLRPSSRHSLRSDVQGVTAVARRQSWQSGRKTVEELEAEYDDSDDVPEDAVIWNVPISPRIPHERSFSPGPEQRAVALTDGVVNARPPLPGKALSSPSNIQSSMETAGCANLLAKPRTRSWHAAIDALSPEARELTAALEALAEENERNHEDRVQKGDTSARSSTDRSKPTASAIELPPVRKGDVMIDPLPISKEKEKVLTRTRPSWLPPKDQKEEKKHLKQYQKMMAASKEAEKRKAAKRLEEQKMRESTRTSISKIWEQHVLPNWSSVIKDPRTRELWWRGIAPRNRGEVWAKALGNELSLTRKSYDAALRRAKTLRGDISKLGPDKQASSKEKVWFDAISRDMNATFPELKIFQPGGPLHETLLDVLMAYTMYRSDVGYVYGTHLIAGILVLNMDAATSFICLANVLNRPLPMSFLIDDRAQMSRSYELVLDTLKYKMPGLHHQLADVLRLDPADYLDPMFRTLFCAKLGIDIASRIWDVYVFEGDRFLIRSAVGVLSALESRLYGSREEVVELLGWSPNVVTLSTINEDDFMQGVRDAGKVEGIKG